MEKVGTIYVSIGLRSALGMPHPDETVDEEASCIYAERMLRRETQLWAEDVTFHVDFGEGEPLCIIEGSKFPESRERDERWVIETVLEWLRENEWLTFRHPYIGTHLQWNRLINSIRGERMKDFWQEYFAYKLKKFEENSIVLTEDTAIVMYLGDSDTAEVVFGAEEEGLREVSIRNVIPPHEVTEIIYPLTALETGFEHDRDIDMFRSLERLAMAWKKEAQNLFPNANIVFVPLPREKDRVGSVSMFVDDNILYDPFELEQAFFSLGGPIVIQPELWYTARV